MFERHVESLPQFHDFARSQIEQGGLDRYRMPLREPQLREQVERVHELAMTLLGCLDPARSSARWLVHAGESDGQSAGSMAQCALNADGKQNGHQPTLHDRGDWRLDTGRVRWLTLGGELGLRGTVDHDDLRCLPRGGKLPNGVSFALGARLPMVDVKQHHMMVPRVPTCQRGRRYPAPGEHDCLLHDLASRGPILPRPYISAGGRLSRHTDSAQVSLLPPWLGRTTLWRFIAGEVPREAKETTMAEVTPFAAIRYDYSKVGGDLSNLIAPPYDVLDQSDKDALLAKDGHNIVGIDLPHMPPKSKGPDEAYAASAKLLDAWLGDGTLVREPKPAIYLYHQTFEYAGKTHTRRKLIARVRLQPFSEGVVLPHEKTFGGAKEDRLALMKATKVNMSPIFGLFTDQEDKVGKAMASTAARKPEITAKLEGVTNELWIESDEGVCAAVATAMADKKIYIADGHHRYGTALLYRDWLAEQHGGSLPADHPANFVMFVLAGMEDPGCLIIPYHRALAQIDLKTIVDALVARHRGV